ncbi:MAG TPA: hypothetical protein VM734_27420 [Kofleriaceae bacterium]|nr:hypothetical protein [Kofleriaceae bacterium]
MSWINWRRHALWTPDHPPPPREDLSAGDEGVDDPPLPADRVPPEELQDVPLTESRYERYRRTTGK